MMAPRLSLPHRLWVAFNREEKSMRHYEVMLLVHPDQSEQVPAMLERYRALIEGAQGRIHRLEDLGRRQLAYPIKKVHKAHYILMNIECDQAMRSELDNLFRFNDAILRRLILIKEAAVTTPSALLKSAKDEYRGNGFGSSRDESDEQVAV